MIRRLLHHAKDLARGSAPLGKLRSPHWHQTVKQYRAVHPEGCAGCGTAKKLEVHHKRPFHLHPELELAWDNFILLCRRCHQFLGHLDDWKSFNAEVADDAAHWLAKIDQRPEDSSEAA